MKISVISGGFDPIHSGHISYINSASEQGDYLIVALNSDEWLVNKKGKYFLPFEERKNILENLEKVNEVISFEDDEIGSCINALKKIKKMYPDCDIVFCNGGDRDNKNCPEMQVKDIEFIFSVGGDNKANSSSWILKNWEEKKSEFKRTWGKYTILFEDEGIKVKELVVEPNQGMSYQRHFKRNEVWCISNGSCIVKHSTGEPEDFTIKELKKHDVISIECGDWHQIINKTSDVCKIIEIQYGSQTEETDIERLYYYDNEKES